MVRSQHLESDDSLSLCPTIYQEYIPGTRHIRVCYFGENTYTAMIESPELDWRQSLNVPVSEHRLDEETKRKLRAVLDSLKLKMGIFDLKLTENGDAVWLEINPQGQFLFIEGLSGMPLTAIFAQFLYDEARSKSETR
jgi:hypothetical protein